MGGPEDSIALLHSHSRHARPGAPRVLASVAAHTTESDHSARNRQRPHSCVSAVWPPLRPQHQGKLWPTKLWPRQCRKLWPTSGGATAAACGPTPTNLQRLAARISMSHALPSSSSSSSSSSTKCAALCIVVRLATLTTLTRASSAKHTTLMLAAGPQCAELRLQASS